MRCFFPAARCALVGAIVAAFVSATLPAHADERAQATTVALARFEDGKKAFEGGKFEEALIAFQSSLSLLPSPNTRLYIGRCHRALGHTATAYVNLRLASREAQDRLSASGEKRYAATRNTAASEAAEIEPKVPRLTLAVASDLPPEAHIELDGEELPRLGWGTAVETDPGPHEVRANGARFRPFQHRFDLKAGEQKRIDIVLERLPTATLGLRFATRPAGMSIEIDGRPIEPTDVEKAREVDAGVRRVVVRAPGYDDFVWTRRLADRDVEVVHVRLAPVVFPGHVTGTPRWLFLSAGALGVAAIGTGTALAIHAKNLSAEQQQKDALFRDASVRDQIGHFGTGADALFVGGGLSLAVTSVLFFTTNWGHAPRRSGAAGSTGIAWIAPTLNSTGIGFVGGLW